VCDDRPEPWCWEGSVNFSLGGWSQVNTALFFHSQPYRDAFVNQFNHLRYFAWTQERSKQLMKTAPQGALTPPADVPAPAPSPAAGKKKAPVRKKTPAKPQVPAKAHQWNGDLVTMGWWDDIWLNESFASWRSAKETDLRNPTWNWWEKQDADKEEAMSADAHVSSHPIAQPVSDELKAMSAFNPAVTYSKGQAVLRMLEAYLGPDTFRDGIRRYVKARAYSNATSADLWKALGTASGKDVAGVASSWIDQPGFLLQLRHTVLLDLGAWGDASTLAEARKRFVGFVADRNAVAVDDQPTLLSIVAINADQATFDQLHAIAKSAKNETKSRRYYAALMNVRDPKLAQQGLAIALSPEIPKQADRMRIRLVLDVAEYRPRLSWQAFTKNEARLMAPMSTFGPLFLAQYIPQSYWNAVPLPVLERWIKARIPAELAPELSRGMEGALLSVDKKTALTPAADAYVSALRLRNRSSAK
jgi:hypothetical protein